MMARSGEGDWLCGIQRLRCKLDDYHYRKLWTLRLVRRRNASHPVRSLDCWFESGSMPFAPVQYPFENKENLKQVFFQLALSLRRLTRHAVGFIT